MRSILAKSPKNKEVKKVAKQKSKPSQADDDIQFEEVTNNDTIKPQEPAIDEVVAEEEITETEVVQEETLEPVAEEVVEAPEVQVEEEEIVSDNATVLEDVKEESIEAAEELVSDDVVPSESEFVEDDDELVYDDGNSADEDRLIDDNLNGEIDDYIFEDKAQNDATQEIARIVSNAIEVDANAKKYVIYIDSDNIEFVENLSIVDRRKVINDIIREKNVELKKVKKIEARRVFVKHVIVATLTFVIVFPLLFLLVNKSMEITMYNYARARENFAKLYKQHGKVQLGVPNAAEKFKY